MENIVIIGFMGSGKSSVGKELAKYTQKQFLDSDLFISNQEGLSISEIFNSRGEAYFRELERDFIHWVQKNIFGAVIATGGGMPIFNDISKLGMVVYLKIDFDEIKKRLHPDEIKKRPLLENMHQAKRLYQERERIYQRVANKIVDADAPIEKIIKEILNLV
ncbi:shikimate kinase [Helicobacter cappadocius]|uniref:Shikimate kinase n=1 Tax=Helicobacter cappadocius TaxID=3063998 RepID=A0AA90TCE6_9HELI|nr:MULTISPECIES: shikimate kinase [unclassified Helicobacter]MDO7253681.1 shikimate kinase [Helicobacter sp. faydin-H75]MDP2539631.1 shikimate kinase [Helicobacter sp. faydin-H76]